MPRPKRALQETDANNPPAKKTAKGSVKGPAAKATAKPAAKNVAAQESTTVEAVQLPPTPKTKFVTTCPPIAGFYDSEDSEEEPEDNLEKDSEEGTEKASESSLCGRPNCKCSKPREENPDWPFFFTKEGLDYGCKLRFEKQCRDQDINGVYFYNDFSGYGTREVIENSLIEFNKVIFKKKNFTPAMKWVTVEGIALLLEDELFYWMGSDDGEGNSEIVAMVGTMLLTTLVMLDKAKLLKNDSEIQNIGLVVAMYIDFAIGNWEPLDPGDGNIGWVKPVVLMLQKNGVEIPIVKGMFKDMETRLQQIREEGEQYWDEAAEEPKVNKDWEPEFDYTGDMRNWYRWDWKTEWAIFYPEHDGGSDYDITKMSEAELAEHRF